MTNGLKTCPCGWELPIDFVVCQSWELEADAEIANVLAERCTSKVSMQCPRCDVTLESPANTIVGEH